MKKEGKPPYGAMLLTPKLVHHQQIIDFLAETNIF